MMTKPAGGPATLSADVAAEIRAWMGRLGVTQAELARRLGQNAQWVSVRISRGATVAMNLDEMQRVADALGILVKDLLPAYALERNASTAINTATTRYRPNAERATLDAVRTIITAAITRTDDPLPDTPPARRRRRPKAATATTDPLRPSLLPRPVAV